VVKEVAEEDTYYYDEEDDSDNEEANIKAVMAYERVWDGGHQMNNMIQKSNQIKSDLN